MYVVIQLEEKFSANIANVKFALDRISIAFSSHPINIFASTKIPLQFYTVYRACNEYVNRLNPRKSFVFPHSIY